MKLHHIVPVVAVLVLIVAGCGGPETSLTPQIAPQEDAAREDAMQRPVEATSLLGQPLYRPVLDEEFRQRQEALLATALEDLEDRPEDPDAIIWVGRRQAYLGRYEQAIGFYSGGIGLHPEEPRFYRHRGHRWISVRRLDRAIADFERAAELIAGTADEVEPDGLPNDRGIPTSTLHTNVWYHLGLAHYLQHDFERALEAYRHCLEASKNPDMLVATSHWLYMTLRRLGRDASEVLEPIHADLDVIENHAYHQLLLMYRGERDPEEMLAEARGQGEASLATSGYGIGNWFFYNDDRERASKIFREIVATEAWPSFGYIAAEAELANWDSLVPSSVAGEE